MDRLTEIGLDKIQYNSFWVSHHAAEVLRAVELISALPEWQTSAEAALASAELAARIAVEHLQSARKHFAGRKAA